VTRTEVLRLVTTLLWVFAIGMLAAERRIIRNLRRAAAVGPDTAVPLSLWSPAARFRLARMRNAGAVVDAGSGRFYLDEEGFHRYRRARRRRAFRVLAVVLALFLLSWWLAGSRG